MHNKSISYVNIYFPPFRGAGAVRAISFLNFFAKKKFDLIVYAPNHSLRSEIYELIGIKIPLATNKDRITKRLFFEILYSIEAFFRILVGRKTGYAILSSPSFFVSFFASLAFHLKQTRVIVDIRDLYPEVLFRLNIIQSDSLAGKILIAMERLLYRNAWKVLIANRYHSQCTRALDSGKLLPVRNGYDQDLFSPLVAKDAHFTICYHGNLGKLYNVNLLRSIINRLNQIDSGIRFLVIGSGSKDYLVREKIPNLTYIRNVPHEDIVTYISKCHLGLSTTNSDDFVRDIYPVKVFEYIGAEVPCIVIPKGVAGEMLEKNNLGYQFENDQLDLIIEKILELKNDRSLYNGLVKNIKNKKSQFTREAQLEKVLHILPPQILNA